MLSKVNFIILFTVLTINTVAQKNALSSITENDLKAHLEFIASDFMQGRNFGTEIPGLEITADYLKSQCKKIGLKPGCDDFFQNLEMISIKPDTTNSIIQLYGENNKLLIESRDFISEAFDSENAIFEGKLVFAGYGWKDEKTGYNDFRGIDVKDKMVLMMTRNRELALDTSKKGWRNDVEVIKFKNIFEMGAKGILLCTDPRFEVANFFSMVREGLSQGLFALRNDSINNSGQIFTVVSNSLTDNILKRYNKTLQQLQEGINESGNPNSFEMDRIMINCKFSNLRKPQKGKNVIGILEGSDPILKKECIVLTAHYDHVGIDSKGDIYNGADDNGSGTVALLEIAEAFAKMKNPPKRSIVFVWFTAEEKGIFGSKFYTKNPVFPMGKTVANINLDMIGRVASKDSILSWSIPNSLADKDGVYIISGKQSSELDEISNATCKKLGLVPSDSLTKALLRRSDYYNFYKNGVPILGLTTGLHKDYHQTSDEIDKIDYNKMKRIAEFAFLVAYEVANQKKRIVIDNPVSQAK